MTKRHSHHSSVSKRLAKVEREMEKDKPEVKTLDVLINPLTATGVQSITNGGIYNGVANINYDLTSRFIQGLLNTGGNIDGNYCKLTSLDLRVLLTYPTNGVATYPAVRQIRFMIVRLPAGEQLTPADIQAQVLEYGDPVTYGQLANVSSLKRNTTINGGYDVMYDRVHTLNNPATGFNPNKSTKFIHFRKKWKKGLTLRFSGSGAALALEQNRILLFAVEALHLGAVPVPATYGEATISLVSRIRYSDE